MILIPQCKFPQGTPAQVDCLMRNSNPDFSNNWQYNTTPATPAPVHNQNVSESINGFGETILVVAMLICVTVITVARFTRKKGVHHS